MLDVNCKNADGFTPLLLVTRDLSLFEKSKSSKLYNVYTFIHVHVICMPNFKNNF